MIETHHLVIGLKELHHFGLIYRIDLGFLVQLDFKQPILKSGIPKDSLPKTVNTFSYLKQYQILYPLNNFFVHHLVFSLHSDLQ